jgi:hypothetical protein
LCSTTGSLDLYWEGDSEMGATLLVVMMVLLI